MTVLLNPPGEILGHSNAIIHGASSPYVVEDFPGPLSIKWMATGWAVWETSDGVYRVDGETYLVLNPGVVYSLRIDADEPCDSFCPFFAADFVEDAHRALVVPHSGLLDDPANARRSPDTIFPEQINPADTAVTPQLRRMRDGLQSGLASDAWLEDQFHVLAERVLLVRQDIRRRIDGVRAARPATREELYRRLCRARDFLHAHFSEPLTLRRIAKEACLAPHHFHRVFREVFGRTPHEYLIGLRLSRARTLLAGTEAPVTAICMDVGFESLGSFSTLFRREVGVPPTIFRRRALVN